MANKSENSEIAVLQTQMEEVLKSLDTINTKLDNYASTFATNSRVAEVEKKLKELDRKKTLQTWVTGTLSAILGAVLTILIKAYFER